MALCYRKSIKQMTTIVVVKKDGQIAIGADSLTKWGAGKESAKYIVNSKKILTVGDSYIAISGNATFKLILADYFSKNKEKNLSCVQEIFTTWNELHGKLKKNYFLMAEEDKEDSLESSRMDVLIANTFGIFGVSGHRTVQEFSKFYAYGSGSDYALGSLCASYNNASDANSLVELAIKSAAEFDDATGLPIDIHTIKIR